MKQLHKIGDTHHRTGIVPGTSKTYEAKWELHRLHTDKGGSNFDLYDAKGNFLTYVYELVRIEDPKQPGVVFRQQRQVISKEALDIIEQAGARRVLRFDGDEKFVSYVDRKGMQTRRKIKKVSDFKGYTPKRIKKRYLPPYYGHAPELFVEHKDNGTGMPQGWINHIDTIFDKAIPHRIMEGEVWRIDTWWTLDPKELRKRFFKASILSATWRKKAWILLTDASYVDDTFTEQILISVEDPGIMYRSNQFSIAQEENQWEIWTVEEVTLMGDDEKRVNEWVRDKINQKWNAHQRKVAKANKSIRDTQFEKERITREKKLIGVLMDRMSGIPDPEKLPYEEMQKLEQKDKMRRYGRYILELQIKFMIENNDSEYRELVDKAVHTMMEKHREIKVTL